MKDVSVVRPMRRDVAVAEPAAQEQFFVIRLRNSTQQTQRIGNYLCRLPAGNTASLAVSPHDALRFSSIQAAEEALAEHLAGLPADMWDAVYEIVSIAEPRP